MLTIGDKFPVVTMTAVAQNGEFTDVTPGSGGGWKVVFFWPADFTFVCPTEIAAFSKATGKFKELGATVVGVSTDTHWVHSAWRDSNPLLRDLRFPMAADVRRELTAATGVLGDDGLAMRATFVVDPQGTVRYSSVTDGKVGRSVEEVLRVVAALQTDELTPCEWKPGDETL